MAVRKPIVAGNWKMNKAIDEAVALAQAIRLDLANYLDVDLVLCPPFTALKAVGDVISGTPIKLGGQNAHWEREGAFTGEISPQMLRDVFCHYVIVGHSERRQFFHETNDIVNRKTKAALAAGLRPIVCVGETLDERKAGRMQEVVRSHVEGGLAGLEKSQLLAGLVIAYEPVWAIGTGLTATPDQAQEVHKLIRTVLAERFDKESAAAVRIQYGGSVKPNNARALFSQPDIDGGLIGGASLDPRSFVDIARAAGTK